MTDGSQFIDIILFAMVALFLGLRLRSVLGRRTGHEQQPPKDIGIRRAAPPGGPVIDNVVDMTGRRPAGPAPADIPQGSGVQAIRAADPSFDPNQFLQGANAAFEMIVGAFAHGDLGTLRSLLTDEVYNNFRRAIEARTEAGEVCQSELVRIQSSAIEEARVTGRKAQVTVRFASQQVIVVKDAKGEVVEGDPSRSVQIVDLWTFEREIRATNPNWYLAATRSNDE